MALPYLITETGTIQTPSETPPRLTPSYQCKRCKANEPSHLHLNKLDSLPEAFVVNKEFRVFATDNVESGPFRTGILSECAQRTFNDDIVWIGHVPECVFASSCRTVHEYNKEENMFNKKLYRGVLHQYTNTFCYDSYNTKAFGLLEEIGTVLYRQNGLAGVLLHESFVTDFLLPECTPRSATTTTTTTTTTTEIAEKVKIKIGVEWKLDKSSLSYIYCELPQEEKRFFAHICNACGANCKLRCKACKQGGYCDERCQKKDAPKHKLICTKTSVKEATTATTEKRN